MTQIFTQYSFRCCDENMTYNVFMHDIKSLSLFSVLSKMNDLLVLQWCLNTYIFFLLTLFWAVIVVQKFQPAL